MNTLPLLAIDNGNGTATLKIDGELTASIDPGTLATAAKQDDLIAKFPDQSGGKVPVVQSSTPPIEAGSAIIGQVGIDQTTPGTTNLVQLGGNLPDTSASNLGAIGAGTDAAASVSTDEDTTTRSLVSLLKGLKNLQIDIKTLLETTGIAFLPLDADIDDIDVSKMSKGAVTIAHSAITETATSSEVDCRGYNSLLMHFVSDQTDKTWTLSITGAMGSGLTFVPLLDKTTGLAASEITTDISGYFTISNVPDYVKIVATEVDDGATVTVNVQPFNG